jgi:hypothetical protein
MWRWVKRNKAPFHLFFNSSLRVEFQGAPVGREHGFGTVKTSASAVSGVRTALTPNSAPNLDLFRGEFAKSGEYEGS